MKIPKGGSPSEEGGGGATPLPERREASAPSGGRGGLIRNREEDEEPPPAQRGGKDHPLTQGGANEPPSSLPGGKRKGRRKGEGKPAEPTKKIDATCPLEPGTTHARSQREPPPKRVRRPTRGIDIDNSCEVTRDSNMICPITCRCHNCHKMPQQQRLGRRHLYNPKIRSREPRGKPCRD